MLIDESEIQQVANDELNQMREDELKIINEFHDAIEAKDVDTADALYAKLISELTTNFQTEEESMEMDGYKKLSNHKADHAAIMKKVEKFHKRWEVLKSTTEVQNFLEKDFKKLYIGHIQRWDADSAMAGSVE